MSEMHAQPLVCVGVEVLKVVFVSVYVHAYLLTTNIEPSISFLS